MDDKLTSATYNWIIQHIDVTCKVAGIHRLKGGISSKIYMVKLASGQNMYEVVVRQIDNKTWLEEEPNLIEHEAVALNAAASLKVPAPDLIAYDNDGTICGAPTLLMSKLPGNPTLFPKQYKLYAEQIANILSKIHYSEISSFPYSYAPYNDAANISIPSWTTQKEKWLDLLSYRKRCAPMEDYVLIHRDFHPNNLLVKNGKVTSVVDWINACMGPRGVDVGHCRWNLAMIYGVELADQFLLAYQKYTPKFTYDVYWDIVTLFDVTDDPMEVYEGWRQIGLTNLTEDKMISRMDDYVTSLWDSIVSN